MELGWHGERAVSWAGVWRWLLRSGPVQSGAPRHPEEPFRETFLGLPQLPNCVNDLPGVDGAAAGVPFTLLGAGGWGDCAGVPGLGSDDDVEGAPAGLPALSLAESLSRPDLLVLFWPSCCAWLTFIFLQLGRTLYFRGRGPFWQQQIKTEISPQINLWQLKPEFIHS